jgi:hypothetical protein
MRREESEWFPIVLFIIAVVVNTFLCLDRKKKNISLC